MIKTRIKNNLLSRIKYEKQLESKINPVGKIQSLYSLTFY